MKKSFAILLSVLLIMTCVPLGAVSVSAATSGNTGDCIWILERGRLTISGNGKMANYSYSYSNGVFNTTAPWGTSIVTSVIIKDGVTSIGKHAFYTCDLISEVTIGNSVTTIGDSAFSGCTSLTSVTIPDSVTNIGSNAFSGCTSLTSVVIGNGVTIIGGSAFGLCSSLKKVTIGSNVTTINALAFLNCTSLTDVYYAGNQAERAGITISTANNSSLTNAKWHYCNHEYVNSITTPADCGNTGVMTHTCSACGRTYTESLPATGDHTYSDCCDIDCNICGTLREPPHDYEDEYDDTCGTCGWWREVSERPDEPEEPAIVYGDASGDGKVNNYDLALLQQYLADWDVTIHNTADVNGNGAINNVDLAMLQQYLAGWDVTLGE